MDIFSIIEAPPTELDQLPVADLRILQEKAEAHAAQASRVLAVLHGVLERRYVRGINKTGTTHIIEDGIEITVNVPKRVKYDQAQLTKAVETIKSWGEDPAEYVSTEIKVSERAYEAWPSAIRDLFTPARTVETGKPSIKLSERKKEAA